MQVFTHLWPFLRYDVEKVVFAVALNDDLVVAGDGRATSKLCPEELWRNFQVDSECFQA